MARLAGIELQPNRQIAFALTGIYGIGRHTAQLILNETNVPSEKKVSELTDQELNRLGGVIEKNYKVEGELRQRVMNNIKRLKDIRCYRGIRHKVGLPVRGQRTRTNAITRKGRSIAVGGLKRTLDKK